MRWWVLFGLMGFSAPVFAQENAEDPAEEKEVVWATADTSSKRFLDDDTPGPELKKGDELVVMSRQGSLIRVQSGIRYGWISESKTGNKAPEE
jgi:hypothetical protein